MFASGWSSNNYSFTSYPANSYDVELFPAASMTADQYNAFAAAKLSGTANSNVVTAKGTVPEIDMPIILKVTSKAAF